MNIISQFFQNDMNTIQSFINDIQNIIKVQNISKVYIFTDTDIKISSKNIIVYNRRTRLKWKDVFKFIFDNDHINSSGCFVIDPKSNYNEINFNYQPDGTNINNDYIFCKNIKKIYNINRHICDNYKFLKLNINGDKIKVASICHIYYEDLLDEMIIYHKNLLKININVDFYFCLVNDSSSISQKLWVSDRLKKEFPNCHVDIYDNKGLDIGTFLLTIKKIYHKKYDYIVKTHTKKSIKTSGKYFGEKWRRNLMSILSEDNIYKIEKLLLEQTEMIGSSKWKIQYENDSFNKKNINDLLNELKITTKNKSFIGGTMFWMNFKNISKHLTISNIQYYYDLLEDGYFSQVNNESNEYLTHSFERLFGYMCEKIDII